MGKTESKFQSTKCQTRRSYNIVDPSKVSVIHKGNKVFWTKYDSSKRDLNIITYSNNEIWSSNRKLYKKNILIGKHDNEVSALLIINSKKMLVSAGWDNIIKIWSNIRTIEFKCIKTLNEHSNFVTCLFYDESINDDVFMSGSWDRTVKSWSISKGMLLRSVELNMNHCSWFDYLHVFGNRQEMITADCDGENRIKIWDSQNGSCKKITYFNRGVYGVLSWDNDLIIIGSYMEIYIFHIATCRLIKVFKECHLGEIRCLKKIQKKDYLLTSKHRKNKGSTLLASAGGVGDFRIKIWDIYNGQCLKTIEAHNQITSLCFVESKGQIIFACIDSAIKVWDLNEKSDQQIKIIQKGTQNGLIKWLGIF